MLTSAGEAGNLDVDSAAAGWINRNRHRQEWVALNVTVSGNEELYHDWMDGNLIGTRCYGDYCRRV